MKFHAFRKDKGAGTQFRYDANWDSDKVYGCVCDDYYEGGDCSKRAFCCIVSCVLYDVATHVRQD